MPKLFFKFLPILFFFVGCSVTPAPVTQTKITVLSHALQSLEHSISSKEATMLSKDIYEEVNGLTAEFELISPPWFHNFLVNVGVRKKGLCYQWSDALYAQLSQKKYPSFEFHLLVSNRGEYFFEHNTLVVVAKGKKVEEGILIDPWRYSGKLYFSKVSKDTKYKWQHSTRGACIHGVTGQ